MHYIAACLLFKDAASYMDEWLRFHLRVGVDHFYLYDNDSMDDYESVVRPFVNAGRVTLYRRPGPAQQLPVYQHCLREHRKDARWLTILDDDEFLFPAAASSLPEALSAYESYAGVAACWLLFGSNGHETRPSGSVTNNYRRRAAWADPHVKCVVDPAKVTSTAVAAHSFHCLPGETIVDERHRPISGPFCENPSSEILCLNHYVIKSHEELVQRRIRPQVCNGELSPHSLEKWKCFDSHYNDVEDNRIQRFTS